jgi:phenylalanyl-tRNA synthetase beta chain
MPVYPLMNPISHDMDGLRNSLVPSLLSVLQWNINRQMNNLAIFELNKVFYHPGDLKHQPKERYHLAVALTGKRGGEHWYSDQKSFDFYDIKGFLEYLSHKIFLDKPQFIMYDNFAVESQAVKILVGKTEVGYGGKVKNSLLKQFDIESPVFVAELDVEALHSLIRTAKAYQEIPKFPAVDRDLAIVVDETEEAEKLIEVIQKNGGKNLQKTFVFDTYSGKQIDAGKKSVAFRLIFQSKERTLTEEEVNEVIEKILNALKKTFNASLRA